MDLGEDAGAVDSIPVSSSARPAPPPPWRIRRPQLFLGELHAKSIGLYLHQQGLDTTTPAGRTMLGVFAEFKRAMIRDRVKACMMRAKVSGTR